MQGTDRYTGQPLSGIDHLQQSIRDILMTPVGSRVMRRDYGSRLFDLLDSPLNGAGLVALYGATAEALRRWEPRIKVRRVQAESVAPGQVTITVEGDYLPDGQPVKLEGIVIGRAEPERSSVPIPTVYPGRANTLEYVLTENGQPYSLSTVTRVAVHFGETIIDSATAPAAITWAQRSVPYQDREQALWVLTLNLGGQTIPAGTYRARLYIYAPGYESGFQWASNLPVKVAAA